ncbi:PaaI family thioesterase [Streptomyces sp. NPDC059637]|uniref:PaaI family thioesterase n=1 Tax=Streptomyces sp. NPDC059637 TaxID=3347752 RepID=UPI00367EA2F3
MSATTTGTPLSAVSADAAVDAAAAAARRVTVALLRAGGAAPGLEEITARLEEVAERLEAAAPPLDERQAQLWEGGGAHRHDPVTGTENAIAPPLVLHGQEDGSVEGTVTLDLPYQGPPGHVHGGVSALLLDHTLGVANGWAGTSGMTAELTLRYHRPTPLFEPLVVTGRQVFVEGRKIRTEGAITAGGRLCVSAEGLFIDKHLPRPGRGATTG